MPEELTLYEIEMAFQGKTIKQLLRADRFEDQNESNVRTFFADDRMQAVFPLDQIVDMKANDGKERQ